jgi:hypothetical protein
MSNHSSKFPIRCRSSYRWRRRNCGINACILACRSWPKNIVGLEKSTIIPSDIASTAHASDFVYNTTHDKLGCWATNFSRKFYEDNGFFLKKGGLEICRKDDDARWEELKRKVESGKAFGNECQTNLCI